MINAEVTIILVAVCLIGSVVSVFGQWRRSHLTRATAKVVASTAFILTAVVNGAGTTFYGRAILAALIFSWVGDVLLLSARSVFLTAGIAAFLLAHIGFAAAFAFQNINLAAMGVALVLMMAFGALMLRWLWPHLVGFYKVAVPIYIAAIVLMTSLAAAVSGASGSYIAIIAAVAFTVSDISVARDRFVERSIVNSIWGLPLYFAAQILFAFSVLYYK